MENGSAFIASSIFKSAGASYAGLPPIIMTPCVEPFCIAAASSSIVALEPDPADR